MSSEHTKGPWRLHTNFSDTVSAGPRGAKSAIARCEPNGQAEANARRIVACVNCLEGISTAEVERMTEAGHFATVASIETERDLLRSQNAELVETLRGIANAKRFDRTIFADDDAFVSWAQSCARHALAKAQP